MIEIRIHGRGGQGGVTLAKIVATVHALDGKSVQAFGLYAAERSGAPVQAFVRADDAPITTRNLIYRPDHIIVLDPTLIGPNVTSGLKPGGWVVLNTTEPLEAMRERFPGYRVGVVDATSIARARGLGTASVPIVNTTLAGAVAAIFGHPLEHVEAAFAELGFAGDDLEAARQAYGACQQADAVVGRAHVEEVPMPTGFVPGLIEGNTGAPPAIRTGQWARLRPHRRSWTPPCNHVCPAGNDVRGFLALLAEDRVDEALAVLHRTSPLPGVCGRVCPAPCMERCNRIAIDGAVDVRGLERYAADHGRPNVERTAARKERVAVVGSGPAGLSASYHLALLGYDVDLYEAGPELGGVLRAGIPSYRLPREVLDREVEQILALGVAPHTGRRVDREGLLELSGRHDAVFVATGLQEQRSLELGGSSDDAVLQGIAFLDRANAGSMDVGGERVVVVGGGNTAFDAARTALRLGAREVTLVYRRTRAEMPAIAEEIEEAEDEGVEIRELVAPVRLAGSWPERRLVCVRTELGEPDTSGRRRPVVVPGSEHEIDCDRVVLALGQLAELSLFPEGTQLSDGDAPLGLVQTPVFVGGDLQTNEGTVAAAIGSGRRAAWHVHHVLSGVSLFPDAAGSEEVIGAEQLGLHLFERRPGARPELLPVEQRRQSFAEVRAGLPDADEANRCLSCGACNACDRCRTFCPEATLHRTADGYEFDFDYCKGCGVCAAECPRGVVVMAEM